MKVVQGVFAGRIADFTLRFATSVLLARLLGPQDRGVLTFLMLITAWLVMFGNFSLADATLYHVGRGAASVAGALAGVTFFALAAGCLFALATGLLIQTGLVHWPLGEVNLLLWLLAIVPLNMMVTNWTAIIQAQRRFIAYNFLLISRSTTMLVAVGVAMLVDAPRLPAIVAASVGASAFNCLVTGIYVARLGGWRREWSGKFLVDALRYGIRGHGSVVLANLSLRFDQLMLGALLPAEYLGWYAIAVSLSELPQLLPDSIAVVLLSRITQQPADAPALTARACRGTILAMFGISIALGVVAPVAIPWVYGAAFAPATLALWVLLPGIVFLSLSKILTKYLYGVGRPGLCLWSTATSALVTAALIVPCVKTAGIVGAGVASSLAYAAGATVDLAFTRRLSGCRWSDFLLPRSADARALTEFR